ncbi:MAG: ATP-binding protein [Lachnospiraceae bacterium]|nr:ATP-binding protein [Lachnospiraceae bacterium]
MMGENNLYLMRRFIIFSVILFTVLLLGGSAAFFLSIQNLTRQSKGIELTQQLEIQRIRLETSVYSEIAIIKNLAHSPLIRRYFSDPYNFYLKADAIMELESYRNTISSNSIFWVSEVNRLFYMDDRDPYLIDVDDPEEYWYLMTLHETESYNFNINYNPTLNVTNLWINAPVFDETGSPIGLVGTGIELNSFIEKIYHDINDSFLLYLINSDGEITGAKDNNLVAQKKQIEDEEFLNGVNILQRVSELLPGETESYNIQGGKLAIGSIPALNWYSVAFMPDLLSDYNTPLTALFFMMIVIVAMILIVFNMFIARNLKVLKATMVELEFASRSKSEFLATMSHEIRTPLNAIIGITQIQLQKSYLPEDDEEAFEKIFESGSGLLSIINDILDMSKIETGKLNLIMDEYDTPSLINDAVQLNIVNIGTKPIDFILDVNENLLTRLYGDELRLKQILNNLLSNAIKYTMKGYVKLMVSDIKDGDDIYLRFTVEDSGQGMKHEDRENLFSKYQRFNTVANRNTQGTGLGLNITKQLIEMMDGQIEVHSEYGKGSTFTVTVKQKAVSYEVIGSELVEKLRNYTFAGHRQQEKLRITRVAMPYGKVLVVDDVSTNLYVAEGLLIPYKLEIDLVDSGFSALDRIEKGRIYDVIFMDHMMPHMDGIETTKKIRGLGYEGTIIALTANALVGNEEMFRQNGFDGFISKPIDIRQLNAALNKFIRDRYPEEAKKYKEAQDDPQNMIALNPRLVKIMCRDAEKAIKILRETHENGDIKLFTTTVHGMKSALASFGEKEASEYAAKLEKAGYNDDVPFINDKIDDFILILNEIIKKLTPKELKEADDVQEETAFLAEQLNIIKSACEDYDDAKAFEALDRLSEKTWKSKTSAALTEIRETLFLHSDFEMAVTKTVDLLGKYK